MKNTKVTYILFSFSFIIVIVVACFFDIGYLIYAKPLIPISLILIHVFDSKKVNVAFVISMLVIMVNDTLIYLNFAKYFDQVAITLITFYVLCIFLLKNYIVLADVKIKKLVSFPIIISLMLISYLIFSVSELVLPSLMDSVFLFFLILVVQLFFVSTCFCIYIIDKYHGNFRLFISASCCLFVSALLLINYFFYYNRIFIILVNIAEIAGLYFFMKFLIEVKTIKIALQKTNYF